MNAVLNSAADYKVADIIKKGGFGKYEAQYFIGGTEIGVKEFRIRESKK